MDCRKFVFWFVLLLCLPFYLASGFQTVSQERTLISPGGFFELGFFSLSNSWYLGIWYTNISQKTYVWVANRDYPLKSSNGILEFSNGQLNLHDQNNKSFWSPSVTIGDRKDVTPELLDNGNFVLRYSNETYEEINYLWQSFNEPTDTLLPQMKLGKSENSNIQRVLTSWRSTDKPASGDFILELFTQNFIVQLSVRKKKRYVLQSGSWNGNRFGKWPLTFNLTSTGEEVTCQFISLPYTRLQLSPNGTLTQFKWNTNRGKWESLWSSSEDDCNLSKYCGRNSYCIPTYRTCACLEGYEPDYSYGCSRKTPLTCGGDQFFKLDTVNFPEKFKSNEYKSSDRLVDCRKMCIEDCQCLAFIQINRSMCMTWEGDLFNLRRSDSVGVGYTIYVKINGKEKKEDERLKIGLSVGGSILCLVILFASVWLVRRKNRTRTPTTIVEPPREIELSGTEINPMDFGTVLIATKNFSNEIGEGGFGKVYKGRLLTGQEIAVKKLSNLSNQSTTEFYTEVKVIANLQHINVVSLLGWSVYNDEKVLIYEYLENGSLEHHLFGGGDLNWHKRYEIIIGIARGLAYMQTDSRVKVIHRDLKPSNILLDKDMIPKISDFGLARIYDKSKNKAYTTKSVGTYGYMSPEYAGNGIYSMESDVYSLGVIIVEIISGNKNTAFSYVISDTNLLTHVWTKWGEGNWEEIVDQVILQDLSPQVLRCIQIGLLCAQEDATDRPKMSMVVAMLENETLEIPKPKHPGFFLKAKPGECSTSTSTSTSMSTSIVFTRR